jgi:glycosyltransferase involved in cell wall biosynthesis
MFESVSGFMFNTEPERDLANRLYDLDAQRCHVVGMGLEPFTADPHAFAKRYHLNTPYLLYSGRREPMKGTPLLTHYMHAFRERTGKDIHLVFTGSGTIDAPPEMSDHILDAGFVSEQEKQEAMAGSLAFCHPSTHESLSIVLLESWLAGRPALVHAGSDVLTYQCRRSGGGLWFRNYPEFEESLLTLIEQPDLANRMGASGQSYTRKVYDWQAVEQRMLNALDGGHAL